MKSAVAALSVVAILTGAPAFAQQPSITDADIVATAPGKAALGDVVTAAARVAAIDAASRVVTLQGPLGNSFTVKVGNEVKNFDQIKVGDDVVVTYLEAMTLELLRGDPGIREKIVSDDPPQVATSGKPVAAADEKVTAIADVWAVNRRTRIVTLRGVDGMVELRVNDPKQLALVEVGEQVKATFVQALAIAVEPATKTAQTP